ncbi:selenocysteine-specific translation elongation factor [Acidobacterium sp. S8]|uniref:selenocysteine-specific translation elongation factor n=1 Tax=Acidobacterium sp. S8 TaxID=1641854 RepID=UPI00131EC2BA|nr:selenocysteine-specific translation elongation factor [Acidobacterium sp. S8]
MLSHETTRPQSIVIGTAGHIDHGKTTLVRTLTGVDTDRLPDEKRRGITIDLGFASLETKTHSGLPLRLSFVDVPGHHHFIRNMLAGAGGIDAVMLVISAEEGVKPQTEEHLAICEMLGVRAGLTVVTKIDRISADHLQRVCDSIRGFLSSTFLNTDGAPVVPVSAHSGRGLDQLRSELASLATSVPARNSDALPRLPIDRAFVMKGFGTVVTGTLLAGSFECGQTLTIEPGSRAVRVRGIQVHGHTDRVAYGGSRVALNLVGIEASEIHRGQTVLDTGTLAATDLIDVEVTMLRSTPKLKHGCRVHFYAFSSEALSTVSLYQHEPVPPGSARLLRLRLEKSIVLAPGDRFVLRQPSPAMTIGGGRILDAQPIPGLRKSECMKWLEQLRSAPIAGQLFLRISRRGLRGLHLSGLSAECGLTAEAIATLTNPLIVAGKLVQTQDDLLLTIEGLESAECCVMSGLAHRMKGTASSSVRRSELRSHTRLNPALFDFVLERLERERKLRVQQDWVLPFDSDGRPSEKDRNLLSSIAESFEAAGLSTPSAAEVANRLAIDSSELRRLMILLLRDKTLVKMGTEELYFHQIALTKLRSQVAEFRGQTIDVARFKQLTGLSRKYAIPLLEYLDRERVTRKVGECRLVL